MKQRPFVLRRTPLSHALVCSALLSPPFASAQAPAADTPQLSPVLVTDRASSKGLVADEASGTKTDLPLRELPQSVRVVTPQAIEDLGATRLDDVLDQVSGVSRQNNFGGLWDNIAIRGMPGHDNTGMATLFNGFSANRGYNAPRDLAAVESIEFLKGTAAALYGSSEPGGTLNIVSKRPRRTAANELELKAGSFGFRRGAFDSTGPVDEQLSYRLNLAYEERDGFRDFVGSRREIAAPAITWKLGPDTVLDYRGEFIRQSVPLDRGVVAVGDRPDALPRERFLGEPGDGDITLVNERHQLMLSHEWSPAWRSRFGLSYLDTSLHGDTTQATGSPTTTGVQTRQYYFRDYNSEDTALQAELQGTVATGPVEHDLLFGVETFRYRMDSIALSGSPIPIDVFDPVYGQPRPALGLNTSTLERQRNTAFYVQDAVKLAADWRLVAGLRFDRFDQSLDNRRTGRAVAQQPTATSPRIGFSWVPDDRWTVYANAGRSFRPNTADSAGTTFDPEEGVAAEAGTKWENTARSVAASLAVFEIRKRNVLTPDPADPTRSIAAGKVRSRGIEFDLAGQLTAHWRLSANLACTDVAVTEDERLAVGSPLRNVPRITGSAMAVYEDTLPNGQDWSLGAGITHVGERLGEVYTQAEADAGRAPFQLPAYTTARLSARWSLTPSTRLVADVDNLFDTTYYASSYSRLWVMPGAPRTISLGLHTRF